MLFPEMMFTGTNSTGSYTGVLAMTLPGRDADHGGLYYYYPGNDKSKGTVALPKGGSAPAGETVYDDTEQSLNGDNYAKAVANQGKDDLLTRLWFDVK